MLCTVDITNCSPRQLETRLCNFRKVLKDDVMASAATQYNLNRKHKDFKDIIRRLKYQSAYIYPITETVCITFTCYGYTTDLTDMN